MVELDTNFLEFIHCSLLPVKQREHFAMTSSPHTEDLFAPALVLLQRKCEHEDSVNPLFWGFLYVMIMK